MGVDGWLMFGGLWWMPSHLHSFMTEGMNVVLGGSQREEIFSSGLALVGQLLWQIV